MKWLEEQRDNNHPHICVIEKIVDETPTEEVEKYKTYQAAQRIYRGKEHGKPSKKDRRELDDFLEGW